MEPSSKVKVTDSPKQNHRNNNFGDIEQNEDEVRIDPISVDAPSTSLENGNHIASAYLPEIQHSQVDDVPILYKPTTVPLVVDACTNIPSRHGPGQSTSIICVSRNETISVPNPISLVQIHTSSSSGNMSVTRDAISPPKVDYYAPPPYDVATDMAKLPTYEEVEREKRLENGEFTMPINAPPPILPPYAPPGQRILTIDNESTEEIDTSLLGTDFMFYIAFFVAFVFNWIGFLLLMCFCHTIASRYGALSGFGLSLAKWTFIVQHSTELASKDNGWLWWLIMTFGLVVCVRALLQYLNIKRSWPLLSASHKERLLFFY